MKKLLSAFLSIFLAACCIFALAGCGKESVDPVNPVDPIDPVEETHIPAADAETTAKVITINLAYPVTFENSYIKYKGQTAADYTMAKRFTRLCTLVDFYSPDVLMLQEVNGKGAWWDYLITNSDSFLNRYPKYAFVGTKNLAGGTNGSGGATTLYNQIYYNTSKFELVDGGTFFCRDDKTSPENQLTGDYEGVYSINNTTTCTYAVLRDKTTDLTAVYATTHLCTRPSSAASFRSYGQARNLTEGLYDIAMQYRWGDEALPVIVGGDFNGYETDTSFFAYPHMTEEAHYTDSYKAAPVTDNSGTARIFGAALNNNGNRIDFVFEQGVQVSEYKVLSGTFVEDKEQTYCDYNPDAVLDGSEYDLTDHLPVYVRVKLDANGSSVAPDVYVNPRIAEDVIVEEQSEIQATSTKIIFDSVELLDYVGGNLQKGFTAAIVEDGEGGRCLRLTMEKSRVDPCISIDYAALMEHLSLPCVKAENYRQIKVEYFYSVTKSVSSLHLGASTIGMVPVSIGTNTDEVATRGEWTVQTFDYNSVTADFWEGEFTYFGFASGIGLMAGDGIYIRSIELIG